MGFNANTSLVGVLSDGPIISMKIYTYDQMEMCDDMNEDIAISQTAQGAKVEKYVVPKFGTKTTARPIGLIKKGVARNSTSFHHRPKRSQAKISAEKAKKIITKTEDLVIRPSLTRKKILPHQKALVVANNHYIIGNHGDADVDIEEPKAAVIMKQEHSKKSLLQNRVLLLSNADPHDSNLQCHEESGSIRYSRRMPVFPSVSSSHANAQPVTSNQCRVSLVGEGGGKEAKLTVPLILNFARQSTLVEGKSLLVPPKLSVVSLKLPNIID
jgi:hypothetical protein